ncbi:RWP-RK domain-containing protein [Microvirga rosea]|uniref:RWP-RK domain-containing protein n=1 Tax=Microvirga rosea TaxID=2715425 RepID=UPI001D0B872D|nr:RWP-RK domain-containing protein [Microvirga rosea]MCB8821926.1 RWP-RK domain-containing protein [Microvirga rosea]
MDPYQTTRRVMYDLVWSKPMTTVAMELGISDVALKKICDRHRIPTPGRGYWAKKESGQPIQRTRFYATADPADEQIIIHGPPAPPSPAVREAIKVHREPHVSRPSRPKPMEFEPVEPLRIIHPSIARTAQALRRAELRPDGAVSASGEAECGIEVGITSVERVIRILDALARALDARDLALHAEGRLMRTGIGRDTLTFALIERTETRPHIPTDAELAEEERRLRRNERNARLGLWEYGQKRAYPEPDTIRTGELGIRITDQYVTGARRVWKDGKTQRLENLIEEIADGMVLYLAGVKARREEHERWQQEWRLQEQRRALARAREEREKRRQEFVGRLAAAAAEISQLEGFLARMQSSGPDCPGEVGRMLAWAEVRIRTLQASLEPLGLAAALAEQKLFPEPDDLMDRPRDGTDPT